MLPNTDFELSADSDEKTSLESSPANETPSSYCARERQDLDYFTGFIDSCDVDGTLAISTSFYQVWKNLKVGRR